ncbi:hypothetical protein D1816_02100 [Aquimarina sp. AD10]|uniref:HAD-IA family hydrolase n=1 Tax=Aquimarina sp. AD10 TaxID=1714849 RepID=UPI000E47C76D|nr:HAD-IA family hydrolase [Aquimarina sp. AD10]AXT59187.1 hypothetical protein D1816_02100 [Aquimarina sp. AD10]RKM93894.1 hypothetical protein D7033_19125 [Aquimarina sp. AD10]
MKELELNQIDDLKNILTNYDNIIFDIGDVILNWNSKNETHDLRQIIKHPIWKDYEKGILKKENAFTLLSSEINIPYITLERLVNKGMKSVTVNQPMVRLLKELKQLNKKLICLTNMDKNSFFYLFSEFDFWQYFEFVYVSSLLSMSKPNIRVFQYVIDNAHLDPNKTIFLDDKTSNLEIARKLGIHTFNVKNYAYQLNKVNISTDLSTSSELLNLLERKKKGNAYLHGHLLQSPFCKSYISKDIELTQGKEFSKEIFSTIVILHTNSSLPKEIVEAMTHEINAHNQNNFRWCFYKEEARPENFPDDLDTTSMILSFLLKNQKVTKKMILPVVHEMLSNRNEEGIIQVYFDKNRPRIDAAVAVNVLYLMYQIGYANEEDLKATKNYIYDFLIHQEYLKGTRYYPSPDVFLFFLSRLVSDFPDQFKSLTSELKSNLISRIDTTVHPLDRALRVISLKKFGIINRLDFIKLLETQLHDGGWPMNGLFIAAKSKEYFGSRELTSSFAMEAIETML